MMGPIIRAIRLASRSIGSFSGSSPAGSDRTLIDRAISLRSLLSCSCPRSFIGLPLETLHVFIGEAEVMADLVDQDMRDDGAETLFVFRPIVENGTAIEIDHVWQA